MGVSNGSEILKVKLESAIKQLPNPSMVLKKKSAQIDLFDRVASHPDIFPQMTNYRDALSSLEVIFTDTDNKANEWFESFFEQFDLWDLMRNAVIARDYGFVVLEVTEYGQYEGKVVPVKIEATPQKYYFFDRERTLRLSSNQEKNGIDIMTQYANKFILVQHEPTLLNPYGKGLLDIAYWLAAGLNGNFEFMLQFAEDDGRDKWIGKYPKNAKEDEISDLLNMLIQLRNNGVSAIPEGMNVEPKNNAGRGSTTTLYKTIDEMLRRKVEKLWTGTDLTMQTQGKGGYSSSQTGIEIREDAIQAGKRLCLSAVNQLITIVQSINGMPIERMPLRLQSPRKLSKDAAEIDQVYFGAGMKPTKELLLKRGYSEEDFILSEASQADPSNEANFSADPEEYDGLLSSFDNCRSRIKKKG